MKPPKRVFCYLAVYLLVFISTSAGYDIGRDSGLKLYHIIVLAVAGVMFVISTE